MEDREIAAVLPTRAPFLDAARRRMRASPTGYREVLFRCDRRGSIRDENSAGDKEPATTCPRLFSAETYGWNVIPIAWDVLRPRMQTCIASSRWVTWK